MNTLGGPPAVDPVVWRKCNICKKAIGYRTLYWVCNVSTCTRKRTGLFFCSVTCWDAHLPMMNHRESWAVEKRSPSKDEWVAHLIEELEPKTRKRKETQADDSAGSAEEDATKPVARPVIIRRKAQE